MKKLNKVNNYRGFSLAWVIGIVVITSIISAITAGVIVYNNNKLSYDTTYGDLSNDEDLNEFLSVYANILSNYYEDVDTGALLDEAIAGMMDYLGDDYTTYLDDESTAELFESLSGEYNGIGVSINNSDKSIVKVYSNTPASKAGIQEGDIIVGFNDTDVTNMTATEVVNLIKNSNDYFTLKLQRGTETISVSLKNETLIAPNIEYYMVENTNIGYLYLQTFSNTLATQVENALNELENNGMSSLIIDLRNNTGGYLTAATDVASIFLEKGERIYSLSYQNDVTNFNDETNEHKDYKIVVLINENTASASEILAAALKQSYGATIVGETSFGKGKVQQTMQLDDGSMVKYTSAYWLTPNGTCIDGTGINPDYYIVNEEVTDEEGNITIPDAQLNRAIEVLQE